MSTDNVTDANNGRKNNCSQTCYILYIMCYYKRQALSIKILTCVCEKSVSQAVGQASKEWYDIEALLIICFFNPYSKQATDSAGARYIQDRCLPTCISVNIALLPVYTCISKDGLS